MASEQSAMFFLAPDVEDDVLVIGGLGVCHNGAHFIVAALGHAYGI